MRKVMLAAIVLVVLGAVVSPAFADGGRAAAVQCYVWANESTHLIGQAYTPSSPYSFSSVSKSGAVFVTHTGLGQYVVTCKGSGGGSVFKQPDEIEAEAAGPEGTPQATGNWGAGGHVQVTAYGTEDADYCKVANWGTGGSDFFANVRCYNHAGGLSDNRFDLVFIW